MRVSSLLFKPQSQLLHGAQLQSAIQPLIGQGWSMSQDDRYLQKTFTFSGFSPAWGFLSQVALYSQLKSHHPRIFNMYSLVNLTLHTDDSNGITDKDIKMAKHVDKLFKQYVPTVSN